MEEQITKDNAHHYVKALVRGFENIRKNQNEIISHINNIHKNVKVLHKNVKDLKDIVSK